MFAKPVMPFCLNAAQLLIRVFQVSRSAFLALAWAVFLQFSTNSLLASGTERLKAPP